MPNLSPAVTSSTGSFKDATITAIIVMLAGIILWFALIDWRMTECGWPGRRHSDRAVGAFLACMKHHGATR